MNHSIYTGKGPQLELSVVWFCCQSRLHVNKEIQLVFLLCSYIHVIYDITRVLNHFHYFSFLLIFFDLYISGFDSI